MLKIDSNVGLVRDKWNRIVSQVPEVTDRHTQQIAQIFSRKILQSITNKGLTWTEKLKRGAEKIQKTGNGVYNIMLPQYAWYLEKDMNHYVIPRKHPELKKWAQAKGIPTGALIFVRRHPFIKPAIKTAAQEMRTVNRAGGEIGKYLRKMI